MGKLFLLLVGLVLLELTVMIEVGSVIGALPTVGLLVLTAAVTSTREERKREFAIMRSLGATGRLLSQVQTAELMGVGLLAGFLASLVAELVGWGLARFAFEFEWTASPWVPLLGAVVGALLALAAGWWGLRDVLRRPVVETLLPQRACSRQTLIDPPCATAFYPTHQFIQARSLQLHQPMQMIRHNHPSQ